jgi:hypothetical protein
LVFPANPSEEYRAGLGLSQQPTLYQNPYAPTPGYSQQPAAQPYVPPSGGDKKLQKFVTNIDETKYWFKQFQIETIELHINGSVETGDNKIVC